MPRPLPTIIIFSMLLIALPLTGYAHTRFLMSEPEPDAELKVSPDKVSLWFSSPVEGEFSQIEVHNGSGNRVDQGDVKPDADDPKVLEVGLPELPPGSYHVNWNVVSRDGHRVKGDFSFTIE